MFLNYKRSPVQYILLYIFTLGIYHFIFKRQVVEDTNKACGGEKIKKPGALYILLYILTLGITGVIYDLQLIRKWQAYLYEKEVYTPITTKKYLLMAIVPFVRVIAVPMFVRNINLVCKVYSDSQFEDDEEDESFVTLSKIRKQREENKLHDEDHEVAGYQVIEEYDEEADKRRVFKEEEPEVVVEEEVVEEAAEEEPEEDPESFYRNKKWWRKVFIPALAVFMLPFVLVVSAVFFTPAVYKNTFVGELGDKYDLLCKTDEPKIVVIGGSSVAFGLDSPFMEEQLGMKVVNFGLYADLGTRLMMDLSKANINKGDIIVLAPEMNAQTLSLYFNAQTTWQALDGNFDMLMHVNSDNYNSLVGASWKFANDKLNYVFTGKRPENTGAYRKENFNEYGDNVFDRPYNEMTSVTNKIYLNFGVNYNDSIHSDFEKYVEYVNDYVDYCERRGAKVYFSFCPMNEAAMSEKNSATSIVTFYKGLCSCLKCDVISDVNNYIMDEGYFFDSEFHLNNAGKFVRTVKLIDDLKLVMGRNDKTVDVSDLPEPPGFRPIDAGGKEEENLYFVLEKIEINGGEYLRVAGLNEEGKKQISLKIPDIVDGIPVMVVGREAFNGCDNLKELYLGENIGTIDPRAFSGASNLVKVVMADGKKPDDITVPNKLSGELMTDGANPEIKFYVDEPYIEAFKSDYFWGDYGTMFKVK